jgi:glycosyltransferase involved in cell wall biosynthesis
MSLNLHIYPSTILYESRMLKVTKSLADSGAFTEIHLVGIHEAGLNEHEEIDSIRSIWRVPLSRPLPIPKMRSFLKFSQWASKILRRYRKADISVVHCHSLNDLPIGVLLKLAKRGVKLVYDAHELETERNGLAGIDKTLAKIKERLLMRFVDHTLVVSESIAAWYREKYEGRPVTLVRNMPCNDRSSVPVQIPSVFRDRFNIDNGIVFLYQGALIRGRGIELLLKAFSKVEGNKHIVFMGYGSYEEEIKSFAARYKNIHFHEAVRPDEVMRYTVGADVGVCLIENTCLSYYYSLPNKLYEYTLAGVPVIVSQFPEMSKLIGEFENGWGTLVREENLLSLIDRIDSLGIEVKRQNSIRARDKIGWDLEEKKLLAAYDGLFLPTP